MSNQNIESKPISEVKEVMLYNPEEGWRLSIASRDSSIYQNPRCNFDTESESDFLEFKKVME